MLVRCAINPQIRTHRWRKREQRRKTDNRLHTSQPSRRHSRSREEYTITASGNSSGRRRLEHFSSRAQDTKDCSFGKPDSMPSLYAALCQQVASTKWFLKKKGKELYLKDSRRFVLHRRYYSRVPGNRSSSSSSSSYTHGRVLLRAPGNWCKKRNKVLQQITQNCPAAGNWCVSLVEKEEPGSDGDTRIEKNSQDVILQNERGNGANPKRSAKKYEVASSTKSMIEDVGKPEKSIRFSEESSRTIHELDNIELHELGQISRTVQCHSYLKHIPVGLIFSSCGICLRRDEETIQRIKAWFQAMIVPYYLARVNYPRGKNTAKLDGKRDYWKSMDAGRGAKQEWSRLRCDQVEEDEKYQNSQKAHGWTEKIADTWTISRRSTSPFPHPGIRGTGTRAPSHWYAMMMIAKLDRWEHEKTSNLLRKFWQVFDQTATWRNLGMTKKTLFETLRWWILQALSNHTQ